MRIGISLASAYPGTSDAEAARWAVERARAAARAGLSVLTLGDHHGTGPVPYLQNVPLLGRLLAEWDERPAGCLFLVPAWNPVLMAEQIGTLAALASGPFIVQTGLGNRHQTGVMGLDPPHLGQRLDACLRVARALLDGERVDDEDLGIRGATIAPRPPRSVEWWIGARSGPALDRAARLGDCWYADAVVDPGTSREQMAAYLDACERHGREPGRRAVRKDVLIGDDDAETTVAGRALSEGGYRGSPSPEGLVFGDPEHVAEQLAPYARMGFTDVIIRTMTPAPQAQAVRSVELAGRVAELLAGTSP